MTEFGGKVIICDGYQEGRVYPAQKKSGTARDKS